MKSFKWRSGVRSERLIQRKRREFFIKFSIFILTIIILVCASSWFLHIQSLQISNIIIHGNSVISDSDLKKITEDAIAGKYFFLFPKSNTFIYPEEKIETSILTSFKQIESIDIVRTNFKTLTMEIEEQKPYALWCSSGTEDMKDSCYFLNKEGLIFSKAPNFTGNVFFSFYGVLEETDMLGKYYLKTNNEFNRISVFIDSIKNIGFVPISLRLLGEEDMELYMSDGSKIIFTRKQSSSEVLDNLKAVLTSDTFKDEDVFSGVEYIDLRFGNKVYFKLK